MLIEGLQLVSADYETQVKLLPPNLVMTVDEIALTYNECFILADQILSAKLINKEDYLKAKEIDDIFDKMSSKKHSEFWTLSSLKNGADWEEIRKKAESILKNWNIPKRTPNLFGITYVTNTQENN